MKYTSIIYLLFFCLLLTGCWNRKELNKIEIVSVIGLTKENDKCIMTSQVIIPNSMGTHSKTTSSSNKHYENYTVKGETLFDAVRNTTLISNHKLFHQHNKALVFSESLAREGIMNCVDFFLRDHDIRPQINIIITKDDISKTLNAKTELSNIPGFYISDLLENTSSSSKVGIINIKDFFSKLTSDGIKTYCSHVKQQEREKTL